MSGVVVFVVQELSSGEFLRPVDGDVGFTARLRDAVGFGDAEEATHAGVDHCDGAFDVVPVVFVGRWTH
ncbi:hypothetical protein CA830_08830 [Burkholderia multivorans]|uniref:hypothetical protein n=1 Tax=Burkholderia multivorans TaxID=87883 RepID=UPI0009C18A6A|nr:hypothetical protein [Burkholderia multivorans]MBJ9655358.1 hypothetical protein [Burkholderia multivorans]MBR8240649.1 hypothetical protein [Burkholderia multivorans]MBU9457296.1 hypothetical protein [Burkholderia multivorans]OXH91799.1 hypothetical protein CA831_05245 [Burkholderia multivorans]OXH93229.1 hypothetical protein CA830_08830 [Burkholderia multivorans]